MTVSNNLPNRDQYTATNLHTVYNYSFEIEDQDDLLVFQRAAGSDPDDVADLLTVTTDYTVTGVGVDSGGTVVLNTGATTGDIITIVSGAAYLRTTAFTPSGSLKAENFNEEFDHMTLLLQEAVTVQSTRALLYPNSAVIADKDRSIPILDALGSWRMNAAGTAIETYQGLDVDGATGIQFLVQVANAQVPNAQAMGSLGTGIVKNTTSTGVQSISAPLTSIDGLTIADQKMLVGVGADTYAVTDLTTYSQSLLALANLGAWQVALGIPGGGTGVYLPLAGGTMTGDIVLAGAATAALNPVTLAQMQAAYSNQHDACLVATAGTDSLSTWSYDNGTLGVGSTLTAPSNGATTFDTSVVPVDGDSIFVIEQDSNEEWHGAYTIVQGTAGTPTVLTRRSDFDQASEMDAGDVFSVVAGDTYPGTQWMMSQTAAITVGTTAITFQQITGQGALLKANNLSDLLVPATARTNLGLGTIATQDASAVTVTGGSIAGTTFDSGVIGGSTPAAGTFTTLIGTTTTGGNLLLTGDAIQHVGDLDNQIIFGTDTQDFQTGGASRLDISDSGVRLGGANSRVTTILDQDDMSSDSPTSLATQQSIKAYVDSAVTSGAFSSIAEQEFTSSGTYTPTSGMKFAIIEAWGAGAGGGSVFSGIASNQSGGAGGGGGAYSRLIVDAATVGASQTVTIGAGGAGGAPGANNNGVVGGDTSVGSLCVAKGGSGGTGLTGTASASGGAGGAASAGTGDLKINGGKGLETQWGQVTPVGFVSCGGNAPMFPNIQTRFRNTNLGGIAGAVTGEGGGGGFVYNTAGGSLSGGAGFKGRVFITEFI